MHRTPWASVLGRMEQGEEEFKSYGEKRATFYWVSTHQQKSPAGGQQLSAGASVPS